MTSKILHMRQGEYGLIAIMNLAGPITEHAHLGAHLQFWLGGEPSMLKVGKHIVSRNKHYAIAINSLEPHATIDETPNDSLCMLFNLDHGWVAQQCMELGVPSRFESPSIPVTDSLRFTIQNLAQQLASNDQNQNISDQVEYVLKATMLAIKDRLMNEHHSDVKDFDTDTRIQKSVIFMRQHLDVRLNFEQVARASGLSRTQFFNLFQKNMHIKPSVFWNTIRMEVAIEKLTRTETPLVDLSFTLGFSDPGNFSRFFRNHSGVCPSQYRAVAYQR